MTTTTSIRAGRTIKLRAGTLVRREGKLAKRTQDSFITIKRAEPARDGKTRIFWKSHGVLASALIS